jgi:hypothetical protein
VEATIRRLQGRIYRAAAHGEFATVKNLQKLLVRSMSAKLKAIRQMTQENDGKHTPGVDGVVCDTPEARMELLKDGLNLRGYRPKPVRRVYIPKGNGKMRPLGIPTVKDRCIQALIKLALEPEWESRFEANSYGFRPGRYTMDAITAIHTTLNRKDSSPWILDADITGCFDNGRPFGCPMTGLGTVHGHGGDARSSSLPPAWPYLRRAGQLGGRHTAVVRESAVPRGDCCRRAGYGERVESAKDRVAHKAYPAQSA